MFNLKNAKLFQGLNLTISEHQRLTFVITNEEQQGWRPTEKDIEALVHSGRQPNKATKDDVEVLLHLLRKKDNFVHNVHHYHFPVQTPRYSTGTFVNKLGIKDHAKLAQAEYIISAKTMNLFLSIAKRAKITNIGQLTDIHFALFHRLYKWAGLLRHVDLSKNGHAFLPHSAFRLASEYIDNQVKQINNTKAPTLAQYAKLLDSINDFHPFRDGNGRSTKTFIQALANQHGQFLQVNPDEQEAIKGLNDANIKPIMKNMEIEKLVR